MPKPAKIQKTIKELGNISSNLIIFVQCIILVYDLKAKKGNDHQAVRQNAPPNTFTKYQNLYLYSSLLCCPINIKKGAVSTATITGSGWLRTINVRRRIFRIKNFFSFNPRIINPKKIKNIAKEKE